MLELESKIKLDKETIESANLCEFFTDEDLEKIGSWVHDGYTLDRQSRSKWEKRTEAAMDLALQIQKDKSFPWSGCSNIAFPLVTIGILQFHARAYPAIISGTQIVKCRVVGEDPTGEKALRANRISLHMSYQALEEDQSWEEQHDRLLINVPCVGTAFVKSYNDAGKDHNVSELVLARDLVIDYWAKSVEDCPRKTHLIPMSRNFIHENVFRGTFRDVLEEAWFKQISQPTTSQHQAKQDNRAGLTIPMSDETTPFLALEQHCNLDLDGDGYAEPYIVTIDEGSQTVLRIVTGFDQEEDIERVASGTHKGKIIKIKGLQYFTKFGFIPSPDGGIYDIGFGVLLGPLNESVNSILNQLVDAGTMANTAGGFLGRGAKIRGGTYQFAPFQWNRVDSTGDDLKKSIFPLPVREPSAVLFQLLGLLIDYTNRVSGATEIMVGENPGQNTPAETSRSMIAQGEKIYSAIYKRIWRSLKEEFKKLYILNGIYMPVKTHFGSDCLAYREDYLGKPDDVCPAADPHLTSEQSMYMQAQMIREASRGTNGYNLEAVERRFLRALKVESIDEIYPGPGKVPALPNPKVMVEQMKLQGKQLQFQGQQQMFTAELMEQVRLNNGKLVLLQAQATKLMAEIGIDQQNAQTNAVNAQIGALRLHNETMMHQIDSVLRSLELGMKGAEIGHDQGGKGTNSATGGIPELAGASGDQALTQGAV